MLNKLTIGSIVLALSTLLAMPVYAANIDPTIDQVYQAAKAGRFDDAQAMMDKLLRDDPNSAKVHYIEAQLLAKQAKYRDAQTELNTAERLDPSLSFVNNKQKVQELQDRIAGVHPVITQRTQPVYTQQYTHPVTHSSGSPLLTIIVIAGLVALFFFFVRMFSRRNTVVVGGGGYPGGYGGGVPTYGPVMGGGMGGGGLGSGILGGLATGAAVGAGIVAGEELMHHFTDHDRERDVVYETPPSNNDDWNRSDDMGGNDFGVSDSSSWDSGSSSSDDW